VCLCRSLRSARDGKMLPDRPMDIRDRVEHQIIQVDHVETNGDESQPAVCGDSDTDLLSTKNDCLPLHKRPAQ